MTWVIYMTLDDGSVVEEPFEVEYLADIFQAMIPVLAPYDEFFATVRKSIKGFGKPQYIGGYFGAN